MKIFLGLIMVITGIAFPLLWAINELYRYIPVFLTALLSISLIEAGVYIIAKEVWE